MTVYLDTSVVLRVLLGQSNAINCWGEWGSAYVSGLMRTEFHRTADRLRLEGKITDGERGQLTADFNSVWATCYQISFDARVLQRAAEPFPTIIGTLDAIHLASALLLQAQLNKPVLLLTHDRQLARGAAASGMQVRGAEI